MRYSIAVIHLRTAAIRCGIAVIHLRIAAMRCGIAVIHLRIAAMRCGIAEKREGTDEICLGMAGIDREMAKGTISLLPRFVSPRTSKLILQNMKAINFA